MSRPEIEYWVRVSASSAEQLEAWAEEFSRVMGRTVPVESVIATLAEVGMQFVDPKGFAGFVASKRGGADE